MSVKTYTEVLHLEDEDNVNDWAQINNYITSNEEKLLEKGLPVAIIIFRPKFC